MALRISSRTVSFDIRLDAEEDDWKVNWAETKNVVPEGTGDADIVAVAEGVAALADDADTPGDVEGALEALCTADGTGDAETVVCGDPVGDGASDAAADGVVLGLLAGEAEAEAVEDGEGVAEGAALGLGATTPRDAATLVTEVALAVAAEE